MEKHPAPKITYLCDYQPPYYRVDSVELAFDLFEDQTCVKTKMRLQGIMAPSDIQRARQGLVLDGSEGLHLESLTLDGQLLQEGRDYTLDHEKLSVLASVLPYTDPFIIETTVIIQPKQNKKLTGLYQSRGNYCTQCESHGFRHITYFLDRPDVMTRFSTRISADKQAYPVLLSNGNLIGSGDLEGGRHWVQWQDPSLKPCYLFALVAGDYDFIEDYFITLSGRRVVLRIFVEKGKADQCAHAMASLKKAMRWDEAEFGREYDLDIYMIVAVSDFNFGAMENKGLNIFNSQYILAKSDTATDTDYIDIQAVIAHEYFHNWTGNRVTCRDWFQLSLKEGLTVFRDQCFTADQIGAVIKRIQSAGIIRGAQFAQDAGPMAHPIRPSSYIEMNNFYTVTVYDKGAEVIRMIYTLLGKAGFRKGMDLYFSRHDAQAVTTDDFVTAMQDASGIDLMQFRYWYSQAGTPILEVDSHYNPLEKTYTLTIKQYYKPMHGEPQRYPLHIPFSFGLLDKQGRDLPLKRSKETDVMAAGAMGFLSLKKPEETFTFIHIDEEPVPSLLRNFSAPVRLHYDYTEDQLIFLLAHDSDEFNRWDAGQRLLTKVILDLMVRYQNQQTLQLEQPIIQALKDVFNNKELQPAFIAHTLMLPTESYLIQQMAIADVDAIHHVREFVRLQLAQALRPLFLDYYHNAQEQEAYHFDEALMGKRQLKNLVLHYLMLLNEPDIRGLCFTHYQTANNMTDVMAALHALNDSACPERAWALASFYEKWKEEALVLDKWFSVQASSDLPDTFAVVKQLMQHPAFTLENPNRARSLIAAFCFNNPVHFHAKDGAGYLFLAEQILKIDQFNPQLAAKLLEPLIHFKKFDAARQILMKAQLQRLASAEKVSKDLFEVLSKSLL